MQARPEFDQGAVDPSFQMTYITLLTVPSAAQQKALNKLLAEQQDPHSPSYHKWLTPEQYASRFGLSQNDFSKITAWLQSQGFTIVRTARGRNWVVFRGTAAQVEKTFQTQIHNFQVDGEMHFANTAPPAIPAALAGIVTGFRGLNNFRPKSQSHQANPDYTLTLNSQNFYFLAPGDIAAIYDVNALYSAGIDGTGQKLAVMGQTDVYQNALADFRSGFGLSAINCTVNPNNIITSCNTANFQYILIGTDPGAPSPGDLGEADLDIEWSGATARNAQIIYVNAPATANGVWDSWYYAVDNNVAPVINLSYTAPCELAEAEFGTSGVGTFASDEAELQKANSEGITFLNSSGDTGAAECDFGANLAVNGYAVSYPASSRYVTGVGGTMIPLVSPDEYTSQYWNGSNDPTGGSAKGYIPEQVWNDSQEFGAFCAANPSNSFCTGNHITNWASAQSVIGLSAGGGGLSNCVNETGGVCATPPNGGFPQPSWQASLVVPGETSAAVRFTPDVSLLASPNFPGYIICTAHSEVGGTGSTSTCSSGIVSMLTACVNGTRGACSIFGGTSVSSPVFAGMVTLLNQYLQGSGSNGLGNINPMLYSLAAKPANGAFNPVTTGSIGVFCTPGTPAGQPPALRCPSSGQNAGFLGFDASNFDPTTHYNLAVGLGSVDLNKLAVAWAGGGLASTTTTLASSQNPSNFEQGVTFTASVTSSGPGTPTGTVTFTYNNATLCNAVTLIRGSATCAYATLPVGPDLVTATYSGDSNFLGSSGSLKQTVNQSSTTLTLASSLNPSGLDSPVTFTATITPQYGGQATGTVTFKDGTTTLGSVTVSGNAASLTTSALAIGTHSITASYSGDSNFTGSTSNPLQQVVTKATTTTTLFSSINPSLQGKPVTFTAVVSSLAGTPTGKIKYLNGTIVLATLRLTSGSAKFTTSKLPPGANSLTAVYEGDSNNNGSTSAPVNQFVLAATTTTLSSSPNPSKYGQAVTFTATVTSSIGAPPDGQTVTFKKGTGVLGTGTLTGGTALFTTSALKVGTSAVLAVYGGDSNLAGSKSKVVKQVVNP